MKIREDGQDSNRKINSNAFDLGHRNLEMEGEGTASDMITTELVPEFYKTEQSEQTN